MSETPLWEQRFRAPRVTDLQYAQDAPHRCTYSSDVSGIWELYSWDREAGTKTQLTSRPDGTTMSTLDHAGENVWWFDDDQGSEFGIWRRQPFGSAVGTATDEAVPGVPAAYPGGLSLLRDGRAVVGCSGDDGSQIYVCTPGEAPRVLYSHVEDANIIDVSEDGTLALISHSEHGDSRHPALRVVRVDDGSTVGDLWDGEGKGLHAMGFPDVMGDTRVLVCHERRGRQELLVWDPVTGTEGELLIEMPGEISGQWWPGGTGVLISREHEARCDLYRMQRDGSIVRVGPTSGVVSDVNVLPDGSMWIEWSSSATPPSIVDDKGEVVLAADGPACPPSVAFRDVWVDGIHAFLALPADAQLPLPGVFVVHGGPTHHDEEVFRRDLAAYVDNGWAGITVNYRGSTGYGSQWRDAITEDIGFIEMEDVAKVRAHLVAEGILDGERAALTGGSWGGFLTLMGVGIQPTLWRCGVAAVPVADYVAAFEDEMEALKAFDRSLFGGSPDEVPEKYLRASPLTYIDAVTAPVLILAGANDPRCPLRQIENYISALEERSKPHEVYRFDAGHGSYVVDERVRQMAVELDFLQRHL